MRVLKKLLCLFFALGLLLALLPGAGAEDAVDPNDERFAGKTWEQVIDEFIEEHHLETDRVGLGYLNTVTGEEQYHNPDTYYIAASMFKVPLNMLFLEKISNGEMDWDTNIRGYRYDYLLRGTIIDSNNDLAEVLWRAYGQGKWVPYRYYREQIAPYMGEDAETVDDIYYRNNLFTSRQIITCLHLLYDNPDRFPRLLDLMKEAEPERYFLNHPQKVEVAHKYGYVVEDDILYLNDCGVCYTEDPICIVCFTMGCPEPYKVLADYCTLMIDYAEYHTAERHRQELEEARLAAIYAMEHPEETPAPAPISAEAGQSTEPAPSTAEATPAPAETKAEKTESSFPIGQILIAVLALAAVIYVLRAAHKKQLKAGWGLLAVLFAALALLSCVSAHRLEPAIPVSQSMADPADTVAAFFDAVAAKDYDRACTYLSDYASLGLEQQPESEAARLMAEALRSSYSYSLHGESKVNGLQASQQVLFEMLDLTALQDDLKTGTEEAVKRLSEELPASQVVDDKGNYLPEITNRAYMETLQELLSRPDKYRTVVGLEIQLTYTTDGWRIVTGRELLNALSGRTAYTGGGDKA